MTRRDERTERRDGRTERTDGRTAGGRTGRNKTGRHGTERDGTERDGRTERKKPDGTGWDGTEGRKDGGTARTDRQGILIPIISYIRLAAVAFDASIALAVSPAPENEFG